MKILKHGDTYKTTTCLKCHAHFSYAAKDIEVTESIDDWCGIYYYWAQILKCPECGEKIILKEICD